MGDLRSNPVRRQETAHNRGRVPRTTRKSLFLRIFRHQNPVDALAVHINDFQ
jgi:hypothetical protein